MPRARKETDESDDCDDDNSRDQQKYQIRRPKIQRLDKFKTLKKIVINVSMTQYSVITQAAQQLNWKIQTSHESGDWDVFWTDYSIDPDILIRMHLFQKINHFPGIHVIARKNLLGMGLMNLRNKFPEEYNFFPLTWMLPQQYVQFRQYYENRQKGKCRTYIVKPEADCQGRGIFLTRKIEDMENGKHYVIQRYIARPYLLDGLKFDFRIYVLFCGTDPLRLYMYEEGLVRFATQKYVEPCTSNLDQQCVHLTNYAINKNNPKFIFNTNASNMGYGHKRSLTCVYKQLAAKGIDIDELKRKIKDITVKTLITGLPHMSHQYKCSQPEDYSGNICFHLLGMDVMLNSKGDPFLIEVNHTPSFVTDTPLDYKIKFNLIKDTLVLMNISVKKKTQLYNRSKEYNKERLLTGKRHIFQGEERLKNIEEAQRERDLWEDKHLGGFQKIFPTNYQELNSKYKEFIDVANKSYSQENGSIRMKFEEKEAKRLVRTDIMKQKLLKKKLSEKPASEKIPESNIDIAGTPRQSIKTSYSKYKKQQTSSDLNSELFSPAIPKRKVTKIQSELLKSQHQNSVNCNGNDNGNASENGRGIRIRPPTRSLKDSSEKIVNSTIRQLRSRIKSKQSNINMGRRPRNQEYQNIPNEEASQNNATASQLFNRSQIIQKNYPLKNQQRKSVKNHKQSHGRQTVLSQPKSGKLIDSIAREIKQISDQRNGNGGYVMPKIFSINFEIEKKMDLHYLTMSKKIQSAHFANQ